MEEYTSLYRQPDPPGSTDHIRWLALMDGEAVFQQYSSEDGVVHRTPPAGDVLVFTNLRVMSFVESGDQKEASVASLTELEGVSLRQSRRRTKDMLQGPILILLAFVIFMVSYVLHQETLAYVLVGALALIGLLLTLKHVLWEEEGQIMFQGAGVGLSFPIRNRKAGADAHRMVSRFFDLKAATGGIRARRL